MNSVAISSLGLSFSEFIGVDRFAPAVAKALRGVREGRLATVFSGIGEGDWRGVSGVTRVGMTAFSGTEGCDSRFLVAKTSIVTIKANAATLAATYIHRRLVALNE